MKRFIGAIGVNDSDDLYRHRVTSRAAAHFSLPQWNSLPPDKRCDKSIILKVLRSTGAALPQSDDFERTFSPSLRCDRDIVLAFARRHDFKSLYESRNLVVPDVLSGDKEVMLEYCAKIRRSLQDCSPHLMDDHDVVMAAIQLHWNELHYASARLQECDEALIRAACLQDGRALVYCRPGPMRDRLVRDYDFVHNVLSRNGCSMITIIPEPLRSDYKLLMTAVQHGLLDCTSFAVKNDIVRAVSYDSRLYLKLSPVWQRNADVAIAAVMAANVTPAVIECALTTVPSLWSGHQQQHGHHPPNSQTLFAHIVSQVQVQNMTGYAASSRLLEVHRLATAESNVTPDIMLHDCEFVQAILLSRNGCAIWRYLPRSLQCNPDILGAALRMGLSMGHWSESDQDNATWFATTVAVQSALYLTLSTELQSDVNVAMAAVAAPDATALVVSRALNVAPSLLDAPIDVNHGMAAGILNFVTPAVARAYFTRNQSVLLACYTTKAKELVAAAVKRCPDLYYSACVGVPEFWNDPNILTASLTEATVSRVIAQRQDLWEKHIGILVRAIEVVKVVIVLKNEVVFKMGGSTHLFDTNRDIQKAWLRRGVPMYPSLVEAARADRELALLCALYHFNQFPKVGMAFFNDWIFMLEAFARNGQAMYYASPEIRAMLTSAIRVEDDPDEQFRQERGRRRRERYRQDRPNNRLRSHEQIRQRDRDRHVPSEAAIVKYIQDQLKLHNFFYREFVGAVDDKAPHHDPDDKPQVTAASLWGKRFYHYADDIPSQACLLPMLDTGDGTGLLLRFIGDLAGVPRDEVLGIYRKYWGRDSPLLLTVNNGMSRQRVFEQYFQS